MSHLPPSPLTILTLLALVISGCTGTGPSPAKTEPGLLGDTPGVTSGLPQPSETPLPPAPTASPTATLRPFATIDMPTAPPYPTLTLSTSATASPLSGTQTTEEIEEPGENVLIGAGDITTCSDSNSKITAKILEDNPGTIFMAGDGSNDNGTLEQYQECFDPTWGKFKERIYPIPGNHDYFTTGARGYFDYFGEAAGDPSKGYYSFDLENWHILALNSNCEFIGGCQAGSAQETWVKADLASHPAKCSLAIWHDPVFVSGPRTNPPTMQDIWRDLYEAGAEMAINGHYQFYERFDPLDADGDKDLQHGIREFVVGTGGASLQAQPAKTVDNSKVLIADTFGVLKLTLLESSYEWEFIPGSSSDRRDSGKGNCH